MAKNEAKPLGDKGKGRLGKTMTARKKARRKAKPMVSTGGEGRQVLGGRVVDSIDLMHRAGQIDSRQRLAACRYRDAWDAVGGGIPSQLDASRGGGGGAMGCVPGQTQLLAAETVREAGRLLGNVDSRLVTWTCCEGLTVSEAAARLLAPGGKATARQVSETGGRLRLALRQLADLWLPQGESRIVARRFVEGLDEGVERPEGAAPGGVYEVEKTRVVHASARNIYENKKKIKRG
jgi:hypothetical protein